MHEIEVHIIGLVQGVSYRAYAQDAATELGLVGYTRNEPDGSVTVCAQGMSDVLKEFIEYLHEGSLRAKVESIAVDWKTAKTVYDDFSIKHD